MFISFSVPISRGWYALIAIASVIAQQFISIAILGTTQLGLTEPLARLLTSLGTDWFPMILWSAVPEEFLVALAILAILGLEWLVAAVSFRRVAMTGQSPIFAALAVIPWLQLVGIGWLTFCRPKAKPQTEAELHPYDDRWLNSVAGMLIGSGFGVCAAMLSTLVFGVYGWWLFAVVPVFIGLGTAYWANRQEDVGLGRTTSLTLGALLIGGLVLVGFAIEGVICLLLASPIIIIMATFGASIGQSWTSWWRYKRNTMLSIAILPLLSVVESVDPPKAEFADVRSVVIAAPPEAVWTAITQMGPIPDAPELPFRWGLAYPIYGKIHGSGVGAIREGIFSTGTAYERVTEWQPNRKLAFIVLSDPPMMHETSIYDYVNAPHNVGYFKTRDAVFTIEPSTGSRTRLTLATQHYLKIGPTFYWLPVAKSAVRANKVRVLTHFKNLAELGGSMQPVALSLR